MDDRDARVEVLRHAYAAFNRRDVDAVIALLDPEVEWPNMLDHVVLHGHAAVRAYWSRQFEQIRSRVEPTAFTVDGERLIVTVHQVVHGLGGKLLGDGEVAHAYTFRNGLVRGMRVYPSVAEAIASVA